MRITSGPEHDPVHSGVGPANPEGPAVRGEDGGAAPRPGDQVQAGGGEPQAEHRQAIQGTEADHVAALLSIMPCLTRFVSVFSHCRDVLA